MTLLTSSKVDFVISVLQRNVDKRFSTSDVILLYSSVITVPEFLSLVGFGHFKEKITCLNMLSRDVQDMGDDNEGGLVIGLCMHRRQ